MNRLNNVQLADLATDVGSNYHSYLTVGDSIYNQPVLARKNYNFGGSTTPEAVIIETLVDMPLASIVTHHYKDFNTNSSTVYKKVSKSHWETA